MRELKNFTPTPKAKEEKKIDDSNKSVNEAGIENMIKAREGKSEEQLTAELLKTVKKSKEEGRFSESEMENFKNTVSPLLNDEQRKKLDEIMLLLK